MAYIAIKPVRFDKGYMIGEKIPDHVIDNSRIKDLVKMGLIQKDITEDGDFKIIMSEEETGEKEQSPEITEETGEKDESLYTFSKLNPMKKEQLIEIAHNMGIGLEDDVKKPDIIEMILEEQKYIKAV